MTPQEALYWCEQFTDNVIMVDPQREKMVLALQAMKVCKEALEKQIPKKPIKIGYPIDSDIDPFVYGYCPCCNTHQDSSKKHCSVCSQALDWSDTE